MVYVELDENNIMDVNDLYWKITPKTCVIIGSAPCFPYGLIDPIKAIGELAKQYNIPFHVDACLGGFIIQYDINLKLTFDDNIQSISVDPHKYGLAPKGSSNIYYYGKTVQ